MKKHPGMEKLEQLQKGKLRGAELLQILRHLESCDECYHNLPPQEPQDFVKRLLNNKDDDSDAEHKKIN